MKRSILLLLFSLLISTYAHTYRGIYVSPGYTQYDHHYQSAPSYGAGIEFYNHPTGLSIGFGFQYTKAKPLSTQPTLRHLVMPSSEIRYYFNQPKRKFSPYIGVNAQINRLGTQFDTPSMGIGFLAGAKLKVDPSASIFAQVDRNLYSDDTTQLKINSWGIRTGIQFHMKPRRHQKSAKPTQMKRFQNRRMNPRNKRPRTQRLPNNPYNKILNQ